MIIKVYFILIFQIYSLICFAQFNGSHRIDSVSTLSQVVSPPNGMEIISSSDSLLHIYINGAWKTNEDSLHLIRIITPLIPISNSQLTNGANYITSSSITGTGNINVANGVVKDYLSIVTTFTPTVGQTITLVKGSNLVNPAGTLLTLTTNFPTSPSEGDIFRTVFTKTITGLTMSAPATINNLLTTILANGVATYQYIGGAWYKL